MARCRCVIVLVTVLALGLTVDTVEAFSITLDGTGGWEASWEDKTLKLTWDKNTSTLIKTVTFTNFNPIPITFEDKAGPTNSVFITVKKDTATNKTDKAWADFLFTLADLETAGGEGSASHPTSTHFHTHRFGGAFASTPLVYEAGGDMVLPSKSFILLGLGSPVEIGKDLTAENFRIHATTADKFRFDEQPSPVPEPATLLLFGTTAAGIGLARWRKSRRKRQAGL